MMIVKVNNKIDFPNNGWLSTRALGPQNGRMLLEVRGHSGQSSWAEGLITLPEPALGVKEEVRKYGDSVLGGVDVYRFYHIQAGIYEITEGQDKKGQRLLRFYSSTQMPDYVLFAAPGWLVADASSQEVVAILECEGHSRTGRHGNRWALIAAPIGATVAVEPYRSGDPIYYRVTEDEVEKLGKTDAILAPGEW